MPCAPRIPASEAKAARPGRCPSLARSRARRTGAAGLGLALLFATAMPRGGVAQGCPALELPRVAPGAVAEYEVREGGAARAVMRLEVVDTLADGAGAHDRVRLTFRGPAGAEAVAVTLDVPRWPGSLRPRRVVVAAQGGPPMAFEGAQLAAIRARMPETGFEWIGAACTGAEVAADTVWLAGGPVAATRLAAANGDTAWVSAAVPLRVVRAFDSSRGLDFRWLDARSAAP